MTNAAFWDKVAPKYARDAISDMAAYTHTRDRMIDILQPHHTVLELGCGTGSTALELAGSVAQYRATDVSPKMIEIARAKQDATPPAHLHFDVADVSDMAAQAHDVILALNLLHLVPDLETLLAQLYDTLPSGGLLITKTSLLGDGPWYLSMIIPVMRAIGKAPFVRNLGADELTELFKTAGFEIDETLVQDGMVPRLFIVARKP